MSVVSRLRAWAADWGSTAEDRARPLPCDALLPDAVLVLHRAVDVAAPPELLFRWVGQLRLAPYSYDLLDNLGRRSPQHLDDDLGEPAVGESVMRIFRIVSTQFPHHLTVRTGGLLGPVVVTYAVLPRDGGSRLLMRVRWTPPRLPLPGRPGGTAWALGDLVMARRQLRTLGALAERDASAASGSRPGG